jgi:hypothetical protein
MKYLNKLKTVTKILFVFLLGIISAQVTAPDCECGEPVNVWYKVSSFEPDKGKIVRLDMSKGKTFTDHQYVYIAVKDLDNGDVVYIMFPKNGDWVSEEPKDKDPFLEALDEEFKNLEDYLRSKESQEIKKKQ